MYIESSFLISLLFCRSPINSLCAQRNHVPASATLAEEEAEVMLLVVMDVVSVIESVNVNGSGIGMNAIGAEIAIEMHLAGRRSKCQHRVVDA